MKKLPAFLIILTFAAVYLVIFNIALSPKGAAIQKTFLGTSSVQKISVSTQVSVLLTRHRPYGTIFESSGNTYLRTLGVVYIPLEHGRIKLWFFHLIFLIFLIFLFVIMTNPNSKDL